MSLAVDELLAFRDITVETVPRVRPSWRLLVGLLATSSTLVLPWLGRNLSPNLSAWHLNVSLGVVPLIGHLTYGEIVFALLAAATVSTLRSRGQATNTTHTCGWVVLATALIFVITTRITGAETLFRLSTDSAQTQVVDRQILEYHFAPPTSFFGLTPDATTRMVLNALRMGWYLTIVAGIMLAGRRVEPRRHRRLVGTAVIGVGLVLLFGLASGLLADGAKSDGFALTRSGHPAAAERAFARALSLNPQLRYDSELETELGEAQGDQGHQNGLAWFAEASSPPVASSGIAKQMFDYSQALSMDPSNAVIRDGFAVALADDMIGADVPVDPSVAMKLDGMAFLSFTYGHYAYETGDDTSTIAFMDKTVADSSNGELQSLAFTYLALSEQRLGRPAAFRHDIVEAVHLDTQDVNGLGRDVAAGLYTPGAP
jgi:hypothetical protein